MKMNRLDLDILKTLILEDLTIYAVAQKIKKPYPTVLRHVKKLLREEYIVERKGKRDSSMLSLTPKGLVMLVFEGDIGKNWASSKDMDKAFEEFSNMFGEIARRCKVKIHCPYCGHPLEFDEDIIEIKFEGETIEG
jgi:DNA-binding transcriptional ArsR family regulator